ncbi:MAG: hypothetical protein ACERKO_05250 [Acetanaerobacterium sp.]
MLIEKGMIVKSIAGRDHNRFFLVLYTEGEFAYVADGRMRPIEKPKKKKARHLAKTNATAQEMTVSTNRQLRQLLAAYNGACEENIG